jgi:hypothetical protein
MKITYLFLSILAISLFFNSCIKPEFEELTTEIKFEQQELIVNDNQTKVRLLTTLVNPKYNDDYSSLIKSFTIENTLYSNLLSTNLSFESKLSDNSYTTILEFELSDTAKKGSFSLKYDNKLFSYTFDTIKVAKEIKKNLADTSIVLTDSFIIKFTNGKKYSLEGILQNKLGNSISKNLNYEWISNAKYVGFDSIYQKNHTNTLGNKFFIKSNPLNSNDTLTFVIQLKQLNNNKIIGQEEIQLYK